MSVAPKSIPLSVTEWRPSYRLIPSRYPTVGLYDRVADPADLDVVFAIEALTNPRIRDEIGQLQLVPPQERVSGAGSTMVMAAFTHLNPEGSRFSDGSYGVYYAAHALDTAVAEVSHHRALFLSRTNEPALDIDLRVIAATVNAELHDLRGLGKRGVALLDPNRYAAPQTLGRQLRAAGSWGVVFPSVRHAGGVCVGVFRPKALRQARSGAHIALHWDGARITHWYEKRGPHALP
ncbi:MAG TPA: RES family NAD+ phosphorylase [Burkholderiaceae bacterium]|nr:RES family NAD+ phosphorylase [Burkholderiaceae bacterium]